MSAPALRHSELLARVAAGARRLDVPAATRALVDAYRENDLLTYASAIAFQVFFALIPLTLFGLGLLGFLHLQDAWQQHVAPDIQRQVSPALWTVINQTATRVLGKQQLFWLTFGAVITIWEISGAMRAISQVFNRIYRAGDDRRSFTHRMLLSFALAAVSGVVVLASVATARFGSIALGDLLGHSMPAEVANFAIRWTIVIALLLLLVAIQVRFAPCRARPLPWVSFGAGVTVAAWVATTLVFRWYLTDVADYGSIFGSLATIIVTMEYLYLSAIVFLTGVQIDSLVRHEVEPSARRARRRRRSDRAIARLWTPRGAHEVPPDTEED